MPVNISLLLSVPFVQVYYKGVTFPCALVHWFSTVVNVTDYEIGTWVVETDFQRQKKSSKRFPRPGKGDVMLVVTDEFEARCTFPTFSPYYIQHCAHIMRTNKSHFCGLSAEWRRTCLKYLYWETTKL